MAPLPELKDPTLAAVDAAIESKQQTQHRLYLGMSGIGDPCSRKLFYSFRWAKPPQFDAATLKRFDDGHKGEDVQAERLRFVDGITLHTLDPQTGRQFGFSDIDDHFKGHMDGVVLGLLQAPKTSHVWEHKQVGEKSQAKVAKLKRELGEKTALSKWNPTYYAQAVLYMDYSGMERHYVTVATPGGRETISVRTDADKDEASRLKAKASSIIKTDSAPTRISETPDYFVCRWCDFKEVCHGGELPDRTCRTCVHSTPVEGGKWRCEKHDHILSTAAQIDGSPSHLFLPSLVPYEQEDAGDDRISYPKLDGSVWKDGSDV